MQLIPQSLEGALCKHRSNAPKDAEVNAEKMLILAIEGAASVYRASVDDAMHAINSCSERKSSRNVEADLH